MERLVEDSELLSSAPGGGKIGDEEIKYSVGKLLRLYEGKYSNFCYREVMDAIEKLKCNKMRDEIFAIIYFENKENIIYEEYKYLWSYYKNLEFRFSKYLGDKTIYNVEGITDMVLISIIVDSVNLLKYFSEFINITNLFLFAIETESKNCINFLLEYKPDVHITKITNIIIKNDSLNVYIQLKHLIGDENYILNLLLIFYNLTTNKNLDNTKLLNHSLKYNTSTETSNILLLLYIKYNNYKMAEILFKHGATITDPTLKSSAFNMIHQKNYIILQELFTQYLT